MEFDKVAQRLQAAELRTCEAVIDLYTQLGLIDPRDIYGDIDGMSPYPPGLPPLYRDSQGRGEVLPIYLTWLQLKYIRDRSRRICNENEFALCAIQNRVHYCVGKGFKYKATSKNPTYADLVQDVIDEFIDKNDWAEREAESLHRGDRDGEFILRFFPQDDGIYAVRYVEPEHVKDPTGDAGEPTETFGVETYPLDLETVRAYWIIENPYIYSTPKRIPADDILHVKFNVDMNAKRGLPTFYPIEGNLRRAEDLQASIVAMCKAQAKIALIRKLQGTARSAAEAFRDSVKAADVTDPTTGTNVSIERMRYGTILTSSGNVEYEFPKHSDTSGFIEALNSELRACAARLNMPEWMFSASTSDANYATALVAEAPSVKAFEYVQRKLARAFGENKRPGNKLSVMWRQIRYSVTQGLLPPEVLKEVEIQVECPQVTARDKMQEVQRNEILNRMGIKSKQTISAEEGLDWDVEQDRLEEEGPSPEEMMQGGGVNPLDDGAGGPQNPDDKRDDTPGNEIVTDAEGSPGTSPDTTGM